MAWFGRFLCQRGRRLTLAVLLPVCCVYVGVLRLEERATRRARGREREEGGEEEEEEQSKSFQLSLSLSSLLSLFFLFSPPDFALETPAKPTAQPTQARAFEPIHPTRPGRHPFRPPSAPNDRVFIVFSSSFCLSRQREREVFACGHQRRARDPSLRALRSCRSRPQVPPRASLAVPQAARRRTRNKSL